MGGDATSDPGRGSRDPAPPSYGRGARILAVGIASTGLFTFAYFSVASYVLDDQQTGAINLLWSILFITISVIYRPVEQLLSRSIATRRAQGHVGAHPLRSAALIQAAAAVLFLVAAFALKDTLVDAMHSESLFWVLVVSTLAYAASYFARGYLAGHEWFGLYGGLVLFESISRFCFPVAVAVGLFDGQTVVALGIAAAPFASLLVIPWASKGRGSGEATGEAKGDATFAVSVSAAQLAEQTLLNVAVILATDQAAVIFAAFMITRAPLQLFQAIQTSLLPHLAGLQATSGDAEFARAIRRTLLAVAGFAGAVAAGLLLLGPFAMSILFDVEHDYSRWGLAIIAIGMGFHLASGALNQAALARGHATRAAAAWLTAAAAYVAIMAAAGGDALWRAEIGYAVSTALLFAMLYRR